MLFNNKYKKIYFGFCLSRMLVCDGERDLFFIVFGDKL